MSQLATTSFTNSIAKGEPTPQSVVPHSLSTNLLNLASSYLPKAEFILQTSTAPTNLVLSSGVSL